MLVKRLILVITILTYLVHFTAAECSAVADIRYCSWNQIYTYYSEIEMADWISVDSPSICGSCSPGMFYSPLCGSPNQERWDGCGSCWPGTYSLGGVRQRCIPCTEGTFSGEFQSTACMLCPFGTFGPTTGLSQCLKCPAGTFYNGTGALDSSVCQGPALRSFIETMALFLPIGHGS
uniref:Tyrosine-protein kinase ephrin type A/B receptor-like domain-containing protein n=1 Tax=Cryptomonas curvata TaxID=233186 RepID=A0A7S0QK89_9CRYP|mmetsp:Transcript_35914/g.75115  ORF Transcript_35914/g.75115 Transcript_35914/m.75115 type:complete len:177 (+) Transcript_35914:115-645(+)